MKQRVFCWRSLVWVLSKRLHIPHRESAIILKEVFGIISEKLLDYDAVRISKFGMFTKARIESRIAQYANGCVRMSIAYQKPTFQPNNHRKRIYTQDDKSVYWEGKHRRGRVIKEAIEGNTSDFSKLLLNRPTGMRIEE